MYKNFFYLYLPVLLLAGAVKFGDLTGDGRTDFLILARDYSAYAFNHDGEELWSWEAPEEYSDYTCSGKASGFRLPECPGQFRS